MTPGANIRVTGWGIHKGRTGCVTETPSFWSSLLFVRVEFDAKPPLPSWAIVPVADVVVIPANERGGPPQLGLFGGAA